MPPADSKRDLLDRVMGGKLAAYVTERRNGPVRLSWVRISGDLLAEHGVAVTDEALRKWFGALDENPDDRPAAS